MAADTSAVLTDEQIEKFIREAYKRLAEFPIYKSEVQQARALIELAAQAPAQQAAQSDDCLTVAYMAGRLDGRRAEAAERRAVMQQALGALDEITDTAVRCDSWQSFPSEPIEKAQAAIAALSATLNPQIGATK
jgi:hypothetical protein